MNAGTFVAGAAWFSEWESGVLRGAPPVLWPCARGFESVELGPGLIVLVGGAPGAGKTALSMQLVTDALRADASLRVLVANVEMSPAVLLERQLARLQDIPQDFCGSRSL